VVSALAGVDQLAVDAQEGLDRQVDLAAHLEDRWCRHRSRRQPPGQRAHRT